MGLVAVCPRMFAFLANGNWKLIDISQQKKLSSAGWRPRDVQKS